ncbi:LysR family transcriptional regulator [Pseudoalteromonas prydzensis]
MWHGLDEFLHVVEHGSFTQAAKAMEVSTSHISR